MTKTKITILAALVCSALAQQPTVTPLSSPVEFMDCGKHPDLCVTTQARVSRTDSALQIFEGPSTPQKIEYRMEAGDVAVRIDTEAHKDSLVIPLKNGHHVSIELAAIGCPSAGCN
jgi:hypothetical protein